MTKAPQLLDLPEALEALWPKEALEEVDVYFGCLGRLETFLRSGDLRGWGRKKGLSEPKPINTEYWETSEIDPLGDEGRGGAQPTMWLDSKGPPFSTDHDDRTYAALRFDRDEINALRVKIGRLIPTKKKRKRGPWYGKAERYIRFRVFKEGIEYLDTKVNKIGIIRQEVEDYIYKDKVLDKVKASIPKNRQSIEKGLHILISEIKASLPDS